MGSQQGMVARRDKWFVDAFEAALTQRIRAIKTRRRRHETRSRHHELETRK
jgi:hypothetical protein